jgi:hypothetical protein
MRLILATGAFLLMTSVPSIAEDSWELARKGKDAWNALPMRTASTAATGTNCHPLPRGSAAVRGDRSSYPIARNRGSHGECRV